MQAVSSQTTEPDARCVLHAGHSGPHEGFPYGNDLKLCWPKPCSRCGSLTLRGNDWPRRECGQCGAALPP